MDPNANLKEQLEMANAIIEAIDKSGDSSLSILEAQAEELARLALALNEWITKGGFLPSAWAVTR